MERLWSGYGAVMDFFTVNFGHKKKQLSAALLGIGAKENLSTLDLCPIMDHGINIFFDRIKLEAESHLSEVRHH